MVWFPETIGTIFIPSPLIMTGFPAVFSGVGVTTDGERGVEVESGLWVFDMIFPSGLVCSKWYENGNTVFTVSIETVFYVNSSDDDFTARYC